MQLEAAGFRRMRGLFFVLALAVLAVGDGLGAPAQAGGGVWCDRGAPARGCAPVLAGPPHAGEATHVR